MKKNIEKKSMNLLKLIIKIIIIIFIFYFLYYLFFSKEKFFNKNDFLIKDVNLNEWKKLLNKNLSNSTATILSVPPENIQTEDCFSKCDARDCQIMEQMKKNLNSCVECHKNPKKCFRKSVIGGNCDDCLPDEKQIDCKNLKEFGCVPPKNIYSNEGTLPYFIEVPDDNLNSPYDKKCIFCWQIHEYV